MKNYLRYLWAIVPAVACIMALSSFLAERLDGSYSLNFPYKQAGLSKEQAMAHLLSRFTFGATPQQIAQLNKQSPEQWFAQQLDGNLPENELDKMLARYDALELSNSQAVQEFPKNGQVLRRAIKEGALQRDSVDKSSRQAYRATLANYMDKNGLRPERELFRQFINQKILRAAYAQNQLNEVMTSFWFNHFNVSITKGNCAQFIPAYERDVIRPNALGKFSNLLIATAQSPAMLYYLDNFTSTGADTMGKAQRPKAKKGSGLNENYAREVMELHTLGVDGGYTQKDVTEAARVLTGWTVYPMGQYGNQYKKVLNRLNAQQLQKRGYVHHGDFLFVPTRHDNGTKIVLGKKFGPNGGYNEGVTLLNMLAQQQATAHFIAKKIAVRFVNDNPPQSLIKKMATAFTKHQGDIKQVLITMVNSPEFWSKDAVREKTKSPFELAIGSVRALNAQVKQPYQLYNWINKMGEKVYFYQAPTGFPDRGQYWINTGSLLSRMNFGLALTAGRIPGISVNLKALNNNHEPESAEAALATYTKLIMPGRDTRVTIERLTPLLNDPQLAQKVDKATATMAPKSTDALSDSTLNKPTRNKKPFMAIDNNDNSAMLAQVAGIIIGSPEYQRR